MTQPRGLRARFKHFAGHVLRVPLIEFCHDCGVRQPLIWTATEEVWNDVMGADGIDGGGVVCPRCFNRRANERGLGLMRWVPTLMDREPPSLFDCLSGPMTTWLCREIKNPAPGEVCPPCWDALERRKL